MESKIVNRGANGEALARLRLNQISDKLEDTISWIAKDTHSDYCRSALSDIQDRITEFQSLHVTRGAIDKNFDHFTLTTCKLMAANALNEYSVQGFANSLAKAEAFNQTPGLELWLDSVSKREPLLIPRIVGLKKEAEGQLQAKEIS